MAKTIRKHLLNAYAKLFGYRVCINWAGQLFSHSAASIEDALDWLRMYPHDSEATIFVQWTGYIVASRLTYRSY